ncbi:hypothetical protein NA57DRAFT_78514 [Rhizodiscina lignyota]|uniref:F-box domain-containing protein n=1 Tax=Rhizodiscina lignyota TaxID=1504668 RepID=A0A9P4M8K9_9PEZI|nr:hypothetical protein NA57DRAFT_78514 [Rhizodiscina lignyota]
MASHFLRLPVELRLKIYDFLLDADRAESETERRTKQQIGWEEYDARCPCLWHNEAHAWIFHPCPCTTGKPFIPYRRMLNIHTSILRVSKLLHYEALPRLYENRMFEAVNFRTFGTLHEALLERYWILDQFLVTLYASAREQVKFIRLPIFPSLRKPYGAEQAFSSIKWKLPNLKIVELEVFPPSTDPKYPNGPPTGAWLHPVMVFESCDIVLVQDSRGWFSHPLSTSKINRFETSFRAQLYEMVQKRRIRRSRKEQDGICDDHSVLQTARSCAS